jgi:hypothetical protein
VMRCPGLAGQGGRSERHISLSQISLRRMNQGTYGALYRE